MGSVYLLQLIIANCCRRCVLQIYDGADMLDIQCSVHHRTVHGICRRDSVLDGISCCAVIMSVGLCNGCLTVRGVLLICLLYTSPSPRDS